MPCLIPPPRVLAPGSSRVEVIEALAREVTRLYGQRFDDVAAYLPANAQFMLDQAAVYVEALINLGVLKAAG